MSSNLFVWGPDKGRVTSLRGQYCRPRPTRLSVLNPSPLDQKIRWVEFCVAK